ncbi:amidohydrolase family protein [Falsihalocynthiibacter sp. S25ZX9]|uniref:amidohydrolase family protein n=1 Tax=Falsihalocynthiibacter sp. S25ZX9 TaxID=3240870 RepID=UPI00350EB2C4
MIIDIYTHIFPQPYFDALIRETAGLGSLGERMKGVPSVIDLDVRFRQMDKVGAYRQVISLPAPTLEEVAEPALAQRLARLANDGLADLVARHNDRFPAFVASVALNDIDGAVAEAQRAVTELGAKGIQIHTNMCGRPLDDPEFLPIFDVAAELGVPIWLHPTRSAAMSDYAAEKKSRFEMWWCFGWPYETSIAMARLVFSGLFDRHPDLRIITHHLGGMIPYFDGRIGYGMEMLGSRTPDEDYSQVLSALKRPHLEYFREFYGDTALMGGTSGLHAGLKFFGADQVVFATDTPFAPIKATFDAIDALDLSDANRRKIFSGNAGRLLGLDFS